MRRSLASLAVAGCAHPPAPAPSCATELIAAQADVARLAGCTSVRALAIRAGGAVDTHGLELVAIFGDLRIGPSVGVDEIVLPGLRGVGGTIRISANGSLRRVFLPALEHAARIEIDGNVELTAVVMPRLDHAGALVITDNAALEAIDASALGAVDELVIARDPELAFVDAPRLHAHTAQVTDAPKLPAELTGQLTRAAP